MESLLNVWIFEWKNQQIIQLIGYSDNQRVGSMVHWFPDSVSFFISYARECYSFPLLHDLNGLIRYNVRYVHSYKYSRNFGDST